MQTLEINWITEGSLDFEYKKYRLLAYLQHCKGEFHSTRLYPPMGELVMHYRHLGSLQSEMSRLRESLPKELKGIDPATGEWMYESPIVNDGALQSVEDIIAFAIPSIQDTLREGQSIFEFAEKNIEINPVGVVPVYHREGYLLLNEHSGNDIGIYEYKHSVITTAQENLQSLSFRYLYTETRSLSNPVENIKQSLARKFNWLPNPATWYCYSKIHLPAHETLLPITKRMLLRMLCRL
jgi:hypothetical protein